MLIKILGAGLLGGAINLFHKAYTMNVYNERVVHLDLVSTRTDLVIAAAGLLVAACTMLAAGAIIDHLGPQQSKPRSSANEDLIARRNERLARMRTPEPRDTRTLGEILSEDK